MALGLAVVFLARIPQLLGALVTETILFPVPHRHFTFALPKMLRVYFRHDWDLLKDMCRIAHECLTEYQRTVLTDEMKRYEYKITANGSIIYNAPSGYHDDCVIALALANSERYQLTWTGAGEGVGGVMGFQKLH